MLDKKYNKKIQDMIMHTVIYITKAGIDGTFIGMCVILWFLVKIIEAFFDK